MGKNLGFKLDLQLFAEGVDPSNVTMQDAKTGVVPVTQSDNIITNVKNGSAMMKLAKAVPMDKPEKEFTYMSGVGAYWVGEGQRIQTSKPTFVKAKMVSKKLAVIIPTSKENLNYSMNDFFSLMQSEIAEAFHKKFDQSCFSGVENPFGFDVLKSAKATGHVVPESANKYDDFNEAMGFIEDEDLEANAIATIRKQRQKYRGTKDDNGLPIFNSAASGSVDNILGLPVAYAPKVSFGDKAVEYVGDWNYAYYGVLKGIEYEILTEATLTTVLDENGDPINLAERDLAAIKATMQVGFMVVKDEAFAVIEPAPGA